jgi:hypothetical protein
MAITINYYSEIQAFTFSKTNFKKKQSGQVPVAHAHNSSYLGD